MKRQLKYGTTVVYNGDIYRISSHATSEGIVKITSLKTSETITIKKTKLVSTPHDTSELIKYKKNYYRISNITCNNSGVPVYELDYVNKFYGNNSKINTIQSDDPNIQPIASYLQEKFMTFLKFVDRYNLTINYLNKLQKTTLVRMVLLLKYWHQITRT